MYYDPYDEDVQVKFHRTDPTGRTVPLYDIDSVRAHILRTVATVMSIVALIAIGAWLWFA